MMLGDRDFRSKVVCSKISIFNKAENRFADKRIGKSKFTKFYVVSVPEEPGAHWFAHALPLFVLKCSRN